MKNTRRILKRILKNILGEKGFKYLILLKKRYFPKDEREAINERKNFYANFIKKGDLCFDVGSNMGNRIEPLLQIEARVVAVEPQKTCYDYLKDKYGDRIILITKGLSDAEGVKKFYISNSSVNSSFSEEWISAVKAKRYTKHTWDTVVQMQMTTLDKLIAEYGIPVFIKIDVEGYELEVIKGLNTPVKLISFEYTTPEQTSKAIDCIDHIERVNENIQCNYSIGESMELALKYWFPVGEMKQHILSKRFIESGFGDIYIRTIN